jgi:tetratricopeptide (TPR) repeat protein
MLWFSGCSNGNQDYNEGKKAEAIHDYDTAVVHYDRALKANPTNTEYQLKLDRMRFEAGQYHVGQGQKLRDKGDLQMAVAEFQKAMLIDPSSPIAQQETKATLPRKMRPPEPPKHPRPKKNNPS